MDKLGRRSTIVEEQLEVGTIGEGTAGVVAHEGWVGKGTLRFQRGESVAGSLAA